MIRLVLTDLDNTLYDWIDYYVPSFLAMVTELSKLTGVDPEILKASFKRVHEQHRTTEYSFAIQELDVLRDQTSHLSPQQILDVYGPAIKAFRATRKRLLQLYDGVVLGLTQLRDQGKQIVAVTDSLQFHALYRLRQLHLEELLHGLISPPDHGFPEGTTARDVRFYGDEAYESSIPMRITTSPSSRKPDPDFIRLVLEEYKCAPEECVYLGDSLYKDILLAQTCGVHDVLAAYGRSYDPKNFQELLKITYWTDQDISEEERHRERNTVASTVVSTFSEFVSLVPLLGR